MNKFTCFLVPPVGGSPLGGSDSLSTIGPDSASDNCYAARTAYRLVSVDKVQVLLLAHEGTFASTANLSVAGKDFKSVRIKYLAPML